MYSNRGECKPIDENARLTWLCLTPQPKATKFKFLNMENKIADNITAKEICTKEVLTSDEASRYMGISKSYLYKLTMLRQIPHYKPHGKIIYFNRAELEAWLQSNRVATDSELSQQAQAYCVKKGGAR